MRQNMEQMLNQRGDVQDSVAKVSDLAKMNDSVSTTSDRISMLELAANRKNSFINGAFFISQHSDLWWDTTPMVHNGAVEQLMDNFGSYVNHPTTTGTVVTETRVHDTPTPAQVGFQLRNAIKFTIDVAAATLGSSNELSYFSGMEAMFARKIIGGTAVMSFWCKSNKAGKLPVWCRNDDNTWSLVKSVQIIGDSTWRRYEVTFDLSDESKFPNVDFYSLSACNFGWQLASGSAYHATTEGVWENANKIGLSDGANWMDSTSNEIYFTGFQIEPGSTATELENPDVYSEDFLCKRYNRYLMRDSTNTYLRYSDGGILSSQNGGQATIHFHPFMRTAPTRWLKSANSTFGGYSGKAAGTSLTVVTCTAMTVASLNPLEVTFLVTCGSSNSFNALRGLSFQLLQNNNANSWLRFHAQP
jgi:hypothetical protein